MISSTVKSLYDLKKQYEYNIIKKLITRHKVIVLYSPIQTINQSIMESKTIASFCNVVNTEQILKDNLKIVSDLLQAIENGQHQYYGLVKEIIDNIIVYFVKMAKYERTKFKHGRFIFVTNCFKFFEMSKCKKYIIMPDISLINLSENDQTRRNSIMLGMNEIRRDDKKKYFEIITLEELDDIIIKKILKPKKQQ
jgi:hypothetical protein